ncbi:MAG: hypothetical protein V4850_00025 [Myxococcota bacterium]
MPYPSPVKANIDAALKRIRAKNEGTAVHFCIVRVDGPKSPPRVIFGRRAIQATIETFKALYKTDTGVTASKPGAWFVIRGAAVIEAGVWTVYPSTKANKVMDPSALKVHLRELKVALTANGAQGAGVDPLLTASVARAVDTTALVDTTPVEPDEVVVEEEEEEEEEEDDDDEEEDEDEEDDAPINELAFEVGPELALAAVRELAARFAAVRLSAAKRLRAAAADDVVEQGRAEAALLPVHAELRAVQAAAERQIRGLDVARAPASVGALGELVARCMAAVQWIEADLAALATPHPAVAEIETLEQDVGVQTYEKTRTWVTEAAALLTRADRVVRIHAQKGTIEELGALLHSSNPADEARGQKRVQDIEDLVKSMTALRSAVAYEKERRGKLYPDASDAVTKLVRTIDAAVARVERIVASASAAAFGREAEDANAVKRGAVRVKLTADLAKNPKVLARLVELPNGPALLDQMVTDIGTSAKTDELKAFVRGAVEARFGCKLEGEHTTRSLPRLYRVLSMVPETHTATNARLATIKRTKTGVTASSGSYEKGVGVLKLDVRKTGWNADQTTIGQTGRAGKVKAFDHVTLHELGHAVDDHRSFMAGKVGNPDYGAWRAETPASIAVVIDVGLAFAAAPEVSTLSEAVRRELLERALRANEDGAKTLAGGAEAWKRLEKHAAIKRCRDIRLAGESGLWKKGDAGAAAVAIGGRVYVQAYAERWCSYALAARGEKVTDYQFRAEGEWFAEIYTAYYLGKLNESGAVYGWFSVEVDV